MWINYIRFNQIILKFLDMGTNCYQIMKINQIVTFKTMNNMACYFALRRERSDNLERDRGYRLEPLSWFKTSEQDG